VAMVGAVLVVVGLLPAFRWGDPLGTVAPGVTWYFVVMAALAAAAGGGMRVPGSRVVATGLLAGPRRRPRGGCWGRPASWC
jgi:hypothetical protein